MFIILIYLIDFYMENINTLDSQNSNWENNIEQTQGESLALIKKIKDEFSISLEQWNDKLDESEQ